MAAGEKALHCLSKDDNQPNFCTESALSCVFAALRTSGINKTFVLVALWSQAFEENIFGFRALLFFCVSHQTKVLKYVHLYEIFYADGYFFKTTPLKLGMVADAYEKI